MSAATALSIGTLYPPLLANGAEAWRPAPRLRLEQTTCRLSPNPVPADMGETMQPSDILIPEHRSSGRVTFFERFAMGRVSDFDVHSLFAVSSVH